MVNMQETLKAQTSGPATCGQSMHIHHPGEAVQTLFAPCDGNADSVTPGFVFDLRPMLWTRCTPVATVPRDWPSFACPMPASRQLAEDLLNTENAPVEP